MNKPAAGHGEGHYAHGNSPHESSSRWRLGFWSLVVTQFQGAFNDNALKFLVIYLIVDMGLADQQRDLLVLVIGGLFAVPFLLFSMTGGYLADKFSKRTVTIGTKLMEVGVMAYALVALGRGSLHMEAVAVFLLSSQAALFGPSKYGLLPELLAEKDLSWGNGVIELGTFLASITATIAAGFLAFHFRGQQHWSGVALLACTFAGLAASLAISPVPAANPTVKFKYNPLGDLWAHMRIVRRDRVLTWAIVGNFYLWFLAALLQFTIVIYGHDILRIDERHISYLQAGVAIGIGLGSLVTGYLSESKIEYGLIPLGAAGMTVFGFLSAGAGLSVLRVGVYLSLLGFFGGFYAVPLNALIQHRPDSRNKGGVIAAANLISWVGVGLAAGVYYLLAENLHFGADKIFFVGACMTLAATLYAVLLLPESVLRLCLWVLTNSLYHIRVIGRDNLPERGAALFLADDFSMMDAICLAASTDRPIRFFVAAERIGAQGAQPSQRESFAERVMGIRHIGRSAGSAGSGVSMENLLAATAPVLRSGEIACWANAEAQAGLQRESSARENLEELLASTGAAVVRVGVSGAGEGYVGSPRSSQSPQRSQAPRRHLPCPVQVSFTAVSPARRETADAIPSA